MEWFKTFWGKHGERMLFLILANAFAGVLNYFDLLTGDEVKMVFGGSVMLLFNKARGSNGSYTPPTNIENIPLK